jgi:hypothetical protein
VSVAVNEPVPDPLATFELAMVGFDVAANVGTTIAKVLNETWEP